MTNNFKSGFVAIIGRPNVGKSTFINQVLAQKISIISNKPQTTRNNIRGIYTTDKEQLIFIDTPGIHKAQHELGNFMNKESLSTLEDVDLVLYVVDGTMEFGRGDEYVIGEFKKINTPVILVINKIDLIKNKTNLMINIGKYNDAFNFEDVYYISAATGENVGKLLEYISSKLENGPMYYPSDQISDHPENFIIAEIIREKILELTKEEVPHSIAVIVESVTEDVDNLNLVNINAVVIVERASQKKIIIGKAGSMIKNIGTLARKELVKIVGKKLYLELFVRVEENWRNKSGQLKKFGYTQQ